eukprot:gene22925-30106_t
MLLRTGGSSQPSSGLYTPRLGGDQGGGQAPPLAIHFLAPVLDMVNHGNQIHGDLSQENMREENLSCSAVGVVQSGASNVRGAYAGAGAGAGGCAGAGAGAGAGAEAGAYAGDGDANCPGP